MTDLITTDTSVLVKAEGYWSKREVLFNPTEHLVILKPTLTSQDIIEIIQSHIMLNLRNWIIKDIKGKLLKNKKRFITFCGYGLCQVASLQRPHWMHAGRLSSVKINEDLRKKGQNDDQIAAFLADAWISEYNKEPHKALNWKHLQIEQSLIYIPWGTLQIADIHKLLADLYKLENMDYFPSRNDEKYFKIINISAGSSEVGKILKESFPKAKTDLIKKYSSQDLKNISDCYFYEFCWRLAAAARVAILLLIEKGICLLPKNYSIDRILMEKVGFIEDKLVYTIRRNNISSSVKGDIYRLFTCSTMRSLNDTPSNLRNIYEFHYHHGFPKSFGTILRLHMSTLMLPAFPMKNLVLNTKVENKKYSLCWCEKNLPKEWHTFVASYWLNSSIATKSKAQQLHYLIRWAWEEQKHVSPWDIRPENLRNPHQPHDSTTFHSFLKGCQIASSSEKWTGSAGLYRIVTNDAKLPNSPLYGQPVRNPFEYVENPFRKRNSSSKTPRSRMAQNIHEAMLDTLLDPDEAGMPTFRWIKEQFVADKVLMPDINNLGQLVEVWNPSRTCCLAVLMLTPMRGVQARWLDQGLMDEIIYSPDSGLMVENTHPLRHWRYPNGRSHSEQYGRPSGVIQFFCDLLTGKKDLCLFVNTNKTQIWDGTRKTGYEMPWPNGSELLASNNTDLQIQGRWLNRIYEIFRYQLHWLKRYDPNPKPLSFFHVTEDRDRVADQKEVKDQLPWFVPIFRDFERYISYNLNGEAVLCHPPISKSKLTIMYNAIAFETQRRLLERGININLTVKGKINCGWQGHACRYDIHSLRVAGISNLIEMGVPAHIVSEYIAGHASVAMTFHYLKLQPFHIREKLLEAMINGGLLDGWEQVVEKLKSGQIQRETVLRHHSRFDEHLDELPEDYAAFAPVEGGLCTMGGKGSRCDIGGLNFKINETGTRAGEVKESYGHVQGGCGNCRFFATGPAFLLEQALVANSIMLKLRASGRERKRIYDRLTEIEWSIGESGDTAVRQRLEYEKLGMKERLNNMEEGMKPFILEWYNRWQLFTDSKGMLENYKAAVEPSPDDKRLTLITRLGEEDFDYTPEMVETSDFGLVRQVVEQARFLQHKGVVIPDDAGRMLREFMDKILLEHSPENLLLRIRDPKLATQAASILANYIADQVGDNAVQNTINDGGKLPFPDYDSDRLDLLASLVIKAAQDSINPNLNILKEIEPKLRQATFICEGENDGNRDSGAMLHTSVKGKKK